MESSIQYKGEVTIKIKSKPVVKRSNEGTKQMFNLLNDVFSRAVNEFNYLGERLPGYMMIVTDVSKEVLKEQALYNLDVIPSGKRLLIKELPIISKDVIDGKIRYISLLTSSLLKPNDVPNTALYALLLDASCDRILAFTDVENTTLTGLKDDTLGQADIEWVLSFSNKSSVEEVNA